MDKLQFKKEAEIEYIDTTTNRSTIPQQQQQQQQQQGANILQSPSLIKSKTPIKIKTKHIAQSNVIINSPAKLQAINNIQFDNLDLNKSQNLDITLENIENVQQVNATKEENINLNLELNDPFKAIEFCILIRKFKILHDIYIKKRIKSIFITFTFNQELTFISDRIPLLIKK